MRIMLEQSFWILLMQQSVIFINTINSSQIVNIQKVKAWFKQLINGIVFALKQSLLFFMPVRLYTFKSNWWQPVGSWFESNDSYVFRWFKFLV